MRERNKGGVWGRQKDRVDRWEEGTEGRVKGWR